MRRRVPRDALDPVAPLAGDLDRGLDGLGAEFIGRIMSLPVRSARACGERAELVVVERAAGQRQPAELLLRAGDETGWEWPKFSAE